MRLDGGRPSGYLQAFAHQDGNGMGIGAKIVDVGRTLTNVPTLLALKRGMKPRPLEDRDCFAATDAKRGNTTF